VHQLQPSAPSVACTTDGGEPFDMLGPRQPLAEIKDPDDYPEPWMVWQIWLFLGVVSAGLFLWLLGGPSVILSMGNLLALSGDFEHPTRN
jgi:hypothetical protein